MPACRYRRDRSVHACLARTSRFEIADCSREHTKSQWLVRIAGQPSQVTLVLLGTAAAVRCALMSRAACDKRKEAGVAAEVNQEFEPYGHSAPVLIKCPTKDRAGGRNC